MRMQHCFNIIIFYFHANKEFFYEIEVKPMIHNSGWKKSQVGLKCESWGDDAKLPAACACECACMRVCVCVCV